MWVTHIMVCCSACATEALVISYGGVTVTTSTATVSDAGAEIAAHAIHWVLSKESYSNPDTRRKIIDGWTLDADLNNVDTCGYINGKYCIVAFRGTSDKADVLNDIQLSMPSNDKCAFDKVGPAKAYISKLLEKDLLIQTTGHSLGGAVARCVADAFQLGVVTFNQAAPPSNVISSISPNQVHYHIVFDIVSAWAPAIRIDKGFRPNSAGSGFTRLSLAPMVRAHALDNFSNKTHGRMADSNFEQNIWQNWYNKLNFTAKLAFLAFIRSTRLPSIPSSTSNRVLAYAATQGIQKPKTISRNRREKKRRLKRK